MDWSFRVSRRGWALAGLWNDLGLDMTFKGQLLTMVGGRSAVGDYARAIADMHFDRLIGSIGAGLKVERGASQQHVKAAVRDSYIV